MLPPRSMVGQLTLDQHIGVRIPGGQPNIENKESLLQNCLSLADKRQGMTLVVPKKVPFDFRL